MKKNKKVLFFASSLAAAISCHSFAAPAVPQIDWLPASYDQPSNVDVAWNMWWGENATSWRLTDNGTELCQGELVVDGNQAQKGSCTIALGAGSHELIVHLKNSDGETPSAPKQVTVNSGSGGGTGGGTGGENDNNANAPAKPVIAWLDSSLQAGNHTISWNMWWGENGNSWTLSDNDEVVCEGALTADGQNAQSGSCSVDLKAGQHSLQVALINSKGSTDSDPKVVSVSGSTDGGGTGGGGGGGGNNIGSGDTPLYTDFDSPTLRQHQPYKNTSQSVVGSYFVEWGIYGRNYQPADIPAANLTHVLYGFIPICGPNDSLKAANPQGYSTLVSQCQGKKDFEVTVHDKFAALEKSYTGDVWEQDYKGVFNQFRRIKKAYPDLKILPSVGGWTLSDPFYYLDNSANRGIFVSSVVDFLKTYTFFDGVDIDWEYPGGGGANGALGKASDGETYVLLMQDLRAALDSLSKETGKKYQVTSAIGAAPEKIARIDYAKASQSMDYIFMMTYDYYGAWDGNLGHHAGIYDASHAIKPNWNLDGAVKAMTQQNVPASKLVAGVAMYGRGWQGVTGVEGNNPFTGQGGAPLSLAKGNGHWEDGVLDYFHIIEEMLGGNAQGVGINGWMSGYDTTAEAAYVWHPQKGQLVTYDNPRSVKAKTGYVDRHGLGGVFSWEIDGDNGELLNAIHDGFSHSKMNQ